MGNGIFAIIDAALIHDLLHLERNENRKALRGEGTHGINLANTDGQNRVQTVLLLVLQHSQLTHMLSRRGEDGFGVQVKLFLGISGNDHGDHGKHHPHIPGGQIVEELLCLLPLQFHVVGDHRREIVVPILLSLPVGYVCLHTQQLVLHFSDRFVRGNGNDINGQHQITVEFRQFGNHAVFDIVGIVLEVQHAGILRSHADVVGSPFHAVGADIIPEIMPQPHLLLEVQRKDGFIAGTVEVVQDTQAFHRRHRLTLCAEIRKMGTQFGADTGEIGSCLRDILLGNGDGDILFLHHAVCPRCLFQQHIVVLLPILVQSILLHGHENTGLEVTPVQPVVVQRDFCRCAAVQRVQQLRVGQEHPFLVLAAGNQIVDVRKAKRHRIFVAHQEDAVGPDPLDGNGVLHTAGDAERFPILRKDCLDAFHHLPFSSFFKIS